MCAIDCTLCSELCVCRHRKISENYLKTQRMSRRKKEMTVRCILLYLMKSMRFVSNVVRRLHLDQEFSIYHAFASYSLFYLHTHTH